MNNICEYPLINFNPQYKKSNSIKSFTRESMKRPNTQQFKFNKSTNNIITNNEEFKYATHNNFFGGSKIANFAEDEVIDTVENEKDISVLFKKTGHINNLGECAIKFYIENKEFKICIRNGEKVYYIEIDKVDEIMKMQNLYRSYDQIVENLVYDNDEINFIQKINNFIEYKTKVIDS